MKLNKSAKIEAVVSDDATRPVLSAPYLEVQDGAGTLISTDGRAMAIIPVEVGEHDVSGWVSIPALVSARKLARKGQDVEIQCNGSCSLVDGSTFPRPHSAPANAGIEHVPSRFPNWRQVVPNETVSPVFRVCLDPSLLLALANALGSGESVTLEFKDELSPIRVLPFGQPGKGILMPKRLPETGFQSRSKPHPVKPTLPPIVRPEPCPIWEAVRGALAIACIILALAVIVGGCWALRW